MITYVFFLKRLNSLLFKYTNINENSFPHSTDMQDLEKDFTFILITNNYFTCQKKNTIKINVSNGFFVMQTSRKSKLKNRKALFAYLYFSMRNIRSLWKTTLFLMFLLMRARINLFKVFGSTRHKFLSQYIRCIWDERNIISCKTTETPMCIVLLFYLHGDSK